MNTKVYEIITERIVGLLKEGVCPWRRPWNLMPLPPQNFASGRRYSGINMFLLSVIGYEVPLFLTFKQVTERGGNVKKGSKGLPIIYWSTFDGEERDEEGNARKIAFLRYYTVFNASQIENVPFPKVESRTGEAFKPLEVAEGIVTGWTTAPRIVHGFRQACYIPAADVIQMPSPGSFDNPGAYYATLFHELGHATGAAARLDRKMGGRYGSEDYSREELVAEMTSAFLCAHCGIDNSTITQQAAYLAGWLKALKEDPKMVVQAAAQAQKAANMILGIVPEVVEATPAEAAAA
jgi:antirestriction protein ArdC